MNSLTADFILEARELLQLTNTNLLALEKEPDNAEIINTSFRAFHTLKGDSGLVDLPQMTRLLHAAEDVLDAIRQNTLAFQSDIMDTLLAVVDCVSGWLDILEDTGALPADADIQAAPHIDRLKCFLSMDHTVAALDEKNAATLASPACTWIEQVPQEIRSALHKEMIETNQALYAIAFQPEEDCFFRGEDPFFLVQQIENARWRSIELPCALPSLDNFDPFRCLMSFRSLAFASTESLAYLFRYVQPQVQITRIESAALIVRPEVSRPTHKPVLSDAEQGILKELLRQLEISVQTPGDSEILLGRLRSTAAILCNFAAHMGKPNIITSIDKALANTQTADGSEPLRDLIFATISELNGVNVNDLVADAPEPRVKNLPPDQDSSDRQKNGVKHVLKVDQARIDHLMNLIGELVIAKNSLPYLAERASSVFGVRELSRDIKDHFSVINRITQDLQDTIMEVRMLPVSQAFQRFPRLVRDTARKLNKNVELVLEGEETEVDKDIVEALGDPLMHIIRNSLDHGIEMLQDRLAVGKPAQGTIRIKASQENGRALIDIRDDGCGIDPERVKRKALERGLLREDELSSLSDADAVQLVFRAGFSTVEKISDLSGRGVGMDVVRSAVDQIGGSVQLNSVKGQGTQILLSLPMTMTSTRAMVVKADNQSFGVPLDLVFETFRAPQDSITRIKRKEVLVRRDRTIPVLRLRTLLELPPAPPMDKDDEYAILITRICGENVALIIDDFAEIVEVILKPMEGVMMGVKGLTSTAILGDGTILLMTDLEGLL